VNLHRLASVGSTLDLLHQLAAAGAPHGTTIVAEEQTAGRGARGHLWHSPRGGLWLSRLVRPPNPMVAEVLSLRVGLALARALDALGDLPPVELKWPNDVLLEGKKAAGILCEARWQGPALGWVAIGLGLNVSNALPPDVAHSAIRLADFRADLTVDAVLIRLLAALDEIALDAATLSAAELSEFERRDWLRGRTLREPLEGTVLGLAADGALTVRTIDGRIAAARSGHVVLAE
jgi:BirA family biotin operon repressor/biotin-[acetyl-CoA-carboxylase] ligase